ncbi:MAG: hypothetical protein M4579_004188 [Chaenotheca gracillima]|nr:MAG: hypothetical protein M4579_004188 [Chaenotheca gracillima]
MTSTNGESEVQTSFPNLPPFPDDIPTAPLLRLSLAKLMREGFFSTQTSDTTATAAPSSASESESERLFAASKQLGFFYLDLRGCSEGEALLEDADRLFGVGEELFAGMSPEDKETYDFEKKGSYHGYKGMGKAVVDAKGTLDRNEFYNVSKDDLLSISKPPLPSPDVLTSNKSVLTRYATTAHGLTTLILSHISTHLGLPASSDSYLPSFHRINRASGDQIRFLRAPPPPAPRKEDEVSGATAKGDAALGAHTDFGSVTILFNRLGGLQVLMPESASTGSGSGGDTADWRYVRPLPGHAIVNLGDALVKFSRGALRSNVHRVAAAPGLQKEHTKYSLVYFARPEEDIILRPLVGEDQPGEKEVEMTSKEWILRRALGKRVGNFEKVGWAGTQGTEGGRRGVVV